MLKLFFEGGWDFMLVISLLGLCMLFFAVKAAAPIYGRGHAYPSSRLYYVRFFGLLALIIGAFGQILGLYEAMDQISQMTGEVSQAVLAGGIRVSSITTIYGFIIFLIAHVLWLVLDLKRKDIAARL